MPPNTFPSAPPSIPSTTPDPSSFSGSAFVQIPNLPICGPLTGFEQLEAVQDAVSRRTTVGQIATYAMTNIGILDVPHGGTGDTTFNYNGVVVGTASSPLRSTLQGGANTVLVANNGEPFFSDTITVGTSITTPLLHVATLDIGSIVIDNLTVMDMIVTNSFTGPIGTITPHAGFFTTLAATTSITNNSLTPTRVVYSGLGGIETDSPNLTFNGTILTSTGFSGPLNGSIGAITPDIGTFTTLSSNTGSFTTSASSIAIYATNLTPTDVVFSGIGGRLLSSANLSFDGTSLTSTGFLGPLNGIVGGITPMAGTFTNLYGSTVTTPNAQITGGSISGVSFSISTLTVNDFTATNSITNNALTSGRVIYSGAGGLEVDSPNLTFNGTILTSTGFSGPINGTVGAITPHTGAFTSLSGTTVTTANAQITGGNISGVALTLDSIINTPIGDLIGGASTGDFTTLVATSSITNQSLTSGRIIYSGIGGIETDSANLTFNGTILSSTGFSGPLNGTVGAITPASGVFSHVSDTSAAINRIPYTTVGGEFLYSSNLTFNGSTFQTVTSLTSTLGFIGATSGTVTLEAQSVAGTYTIILPNTAGVTGQPILSGGGLSPLSYGTLSGNTSDFATVSGPLISTHSVVIDGSGNLVDSGAPPSSGSVNAGLIHQMAYYAATGSVVSGLPTANNAVLITSGTGAPSMSATLPAAVQSNITAVGAVTSGSFDGPVGSITPNTGAFTTLLASTSVTNQSLTSGRVIYSGVGGLEVDSANLTFSGTILTSTGFSGPHNGTVGAITPNTGAFTTLTATSSITNSALTATRLVYSGVAGIETDSANLTFSGTILTSTGFSGPLNGTVGAITPNTGVFSNVTDTSAVINRVPYTTTGGLFLYNANLFFDGTTFQTVTSKTSTLGFVGATSGIVTFATQATAGTYTITLPNNAGTSGQPILSGGGGASPLFYGTLSGNTSKFATVSGTLTSTHGVVVDASGNLVDTGAPPSSGSVNAGTINQMAWYAATGSIISGLPTLASGILATNVSGVPSITTTLPFTVPATTGGTGTTTNTLNGVLYGNGTSSILATAQGAANTILTANAGAPVFSASPTIGTSVTTPQIYGGTLGTSSLTLNSTSGVGVSDSLRFMTNGLLRLVINNGGEATFGGNVLSQVFIASGSSSGNISILPQASAGTYNFNLPTSAGASGQPLLSGGGGATAMTFGTLGATAGGTGLTTFNANGLLYSPTTTTVASLATINSGILVTSGAGVPSISTTLPFTLPVSTGGTGDTTLTANGVLYGNGSSSILATAQGAANTVLIANAGAPSFSAAPTIGTSVTTPQVYGGANPGSQLRLTATSSGSPSGDSIFLSTGGLIKQSITDAGILIAQGAGTPTAQLHLGPGTSTVGTAPLKFSSGVFLTSPESGAVEYDAVNLYVTNHAVRRNISCGNMGAIASTTLTTAPINVGTISMVSAENYIFEINVKFTVSANTVIIGFNGAVAGADDVTLEMFTNNVLTPTTITNFVVNSGGTTTAPGSMVMLKVTGFIAANSTGSFSMTLRTTAGTVTVLNGSYFTYTQF